VSWWLTVVRCPETQSRLVLEEGTFALGVLRNDDGSSRYPILGGIPFLVPEVGRYLARHREPVLATLAEHRAASSEALALVSRFTEGHRVDPARFDDDWTRSEEDPSAPAFDPGEGPTSMALRAVLAAARASGPLPRILDVLGEGSLGRVAEIGPGAALLTRGLSSRAASLLAVDVAPRTAFRVPRLVDADVPVAAAVMDAELPGFAAESLDLIVAANVVDLLDDPLGFLAAAAGSLAEGGRLLLTTPDPWPWEGSPRVAEELLEHLGLELDRFEDDLLWLREHGPRELQVFRAQLVLASRR